ncbi:protein-methionine-sulfoxide reductase heme-binding subunit MsrQ [Colwellia sp. MB02u-18]|nr:protein-methionine-sulfoxide reductase heme-binding subunit MsrQ [Colwellia sp. MB3u-45]MBA6267859.1 protein-methionine-sulfoxide reductase heme-binding subunit MsrQ [Colwellia sp. MB3u-43]MBA6322287.1 protein-methionine-sulfoxide reductase heme-binding subunit MsrQ [Colwellia sp. MB02u-19]MBA6323900.1 protein-methionine-sulfoxide reductase heme-binding subunit MsrQ [Colwellia sp. MB02u-18]MBA6331893.1 protein-methionine-sulfoxide reductase heme-binding subunit MsrQ [Colwellia sp. MB02u-12]
MLLKIAIHLLAFLPLFVLYFLAFTEQLGADPVEEVIHFTGMGAFNLLLISLLVTPVAKKYRQGYLLQIRRLVGLYSFTYAMFHLLNFLAFEVQFDLTLFFDEIIDRPYITVGMAALMILFSLAITSITALRRKMGTKWQKLHNGVYLAVLLIALHFFWSVKSDIVEPMIYFTMAVLLLILRKDKIKRWFKSS